jgi:uncharacterized membrane protein
MTMPAQPMAEISRAEKMTEAINRGSGWFERHWLLAFNAFWGIFVFLPWMAPAFMYIGWIGPARVLYFIYNFFCHQLPERSWFLFGPKASYTQAEIGLMWDIGNELVRRQFIGTLEMGWKVAWSDRMVAMYTTIFILGLLYALLRQRGVRIKGISWWVFFAFITPLGIDGATHLINDALRLSLRDSNEWAIALTNGVFAPEFYAGDLLGSLNSVLRLITGILFGIGVVWFLWPMMEKEFGRQRVYRPSRPAVPVIGDR